MTNQRINLRHTYALRFDDPAQQRAYEDECERQRNEQCSHGIRYAVAPRQNLTLRGRMRGPGEAVTLEDFVHVEFQDEENCVTVSRSRHAQLEALVARGSVLEAYGLPPAAA